MSLTPGSRLGANEVVSLIGTGGMGEVYRVKDARLGRDVAFKVLAADIATDAKSRPCFDHEAGTLAARSHAHICPVADAASGCGDTSNGDGVFVFASIGSARNRALMRVTATGGHLWR
jgi:serine/threonine protein kinase